MEDLEEVRLSPHAVCIIYFMNFIILEELGNNKSLQETENACSGDEIIL